MVKNNSVHPVNVGPSPGEKKTVSAIQMKKLTDSEPIMDLNIAYKTTCDEGGEGPYDNEDEIKRAQEILALTIRTK